jgi:prephenate dehydrogenase
MEFAKGIDLGGAHFIGGHPMAGSERSGVEAASSHLYENAYYVLTPDVSVPDEVYQKLVNLLKHTKANVIRLEHRLHDRIVGAISHLPHIIAVALVNQIAGYSDQNPIYAALAAGGFRDLTRIASGDPGMWRDILLHNRDELLIMLEDWQHQMQQFKQLLQQADGEAIRLQFEQAGEFRKALPERRKGVMTSFYDLYVDVPDSPGVIGQIAGLLGSHNINLSNIQIIESRADVPGVLRLSFRNGRDFYRQACRSLRYYF